MIGISGSRSISDEQVELIKAHFSVYNADERIAVGDANGVDALARDFFGDRCTVFHKEGNQKWHFAARSQRMADSATQLYAYPDKACPDTCTPQKPFSGHGSGTWGTIAYAVKTGKPVKVIPISSDAANMPSWLTSPPPEQISLF